MIDLKNRKNDLTRKTEGNATRMLSPSLADDDEAYLIDSFPCCKHDEAPHRVTALVFVLLLAKQLVKSFVETTQHMSVITYPEWTFQACWYV